MSETARPVIVQGSQDPVFRGPTNLEFRCANCNHLLVEGYDSRSLIAIDVECFGCKSITRTHTWPEGEPLPQSLITLGDKGRFLIKGTVDLKDRAAMSCDQEIARVQGASSPRPSSSEQWELSADSLKILETELDVLTSGAIQKLIASARRAQSAGNLTFAQAKAPPVWALMQLHSSLEKRHIDLDGLDGIAISYVQTLRDSLHRWRNHRLFSVISRSLCNEFHHALTAFTIASYLSDHSNAVGFTDIAEERGKSPDLFINFGRNERVSIEVKCPQAFFWPAKVPSRSEIVRRIEREVKDARDQITGAAGGVVVIGAGHFNARFNGDFDSAIKEVVAGGVSRRVAAVAGVAFFGAVLEGWDGKGPKITTGGHVYIGRNPRFPGSNPVQTERPP